MRRRRYALGVGLLLVALVVVGFIVSGGPTTTEPSANNGVADGPLIQGNLSRSVKREVISEGTGLWMGFGSFLVREHVRINSVRPRVLTDDVELLAVRVYLSRTTERPKTDLHYRVTTANGQTTCFKNWPPLGFGPTFEADGFLAYPGDRLELVAYVRFTKPGIYELGDAIASYTVRGSSKKLVMEGSTVKGKFAYGVDVPLFSVTDRETQDEGFTPCKVDDDPSQEGFLRHDDPAFQMFDYETRIALRHLNYWRGVAIDALTNPDYTDEKKRAYAISVYEKHAEIIARYLKRADQIGIPALNREMRDNTLWKKSKAKFPEEADDYLYD